MTVSDAEATPPCFDPTKPLPIKDVKAFAYYNAKVQLESCSVGLEFFYKLIDDPEWISPRHLDMAMFLIRKRQLYHPLQFLKPVKAPAKKRRSKKATASNTVDLQLSYLKKIHHFVHGIWQHGYGEAWTKVQKDSCIAFTSTSKMVKYLHPISDILARVLYNMGFYDASEVEEVKQKGMKMSTFTPFTVYSIGDVPQQRDGCRHRSSIGGALYGDPSILIELFGLVILCSKSVAVANCLTWHINCFHFVGMANKVLSNQIG
ncbi:unnamed protein product [Prunus armeniaca]